MYHADEERDERIEFLLKSNERIFLIAESLVHFNT